MKIFLAGGTGVVGTRALPAPRGRRPRRHRRGPRRDAKADLVRSLGGDAGDGRPVRRRRAWRPPSSATRPWSTWPPASRRSRRRPGRRRGPPTSASAPRRPATWSTPPWRPGRRATCRSRSPSPTSTAATDWIDEDHPVDHVGPFAGAPRRRGGRGRASPTPGGTGVVLRFAQFYAPDSTPHAGLQRRALAADQPVPRRPRRLHLVHPRRGRRLGGRGRAAGAERHLQRRRRRAPHPGRGRPGRRRGPRREAAHAVPEGRAGRHPASAKLLMRSLRVSNRRFKEATGWTPAHPSIRGSWPT